MLKKFCSRFRQIEQDEQIEVRWMSTLDVKRCELMGRWLLYISKKCEKKAMLKENKFFHTPNKIIRTPNRIFFYPNFFLGSKLILFGVKKIRFGVRLILFGVPKNSYPNLIPSLNKTIRSPSKKEYLSFGFVFLKI